MIGSYLFELRMDMYGCSPILMSNREVLDKFIDNIKIIGNVDNIRTDIIDDMDIDNGIFMLSLLSIDDFDQFESVKFAKQYWLADKIVWDYTARGNGKIKVIDSGSE